MTQKQTTPKQSEFTDGITKALRRAAKTARKTANAFGTPIYVARDGKVVAIKPKKMA
jgi:hypothetical protein